MRLQRIRVWVGLFLLWLALGRALPARAIVPAQAATPLACRELVVNGDFEESGPGWSLLAGEYLPRYTTDNAYDGSRQSLLLGSLELPNARTVSAVEQVIALPAGIDRAILAFHYFPVHEEEPGASDEQTIEVRDRASNDLLSQVLSGQLNIAEWRSSLYDLTPYAGREIRLILGVRNDGQGGRIAMYVDGVSVLACGAVLAPTATLMPTPLPTSLPLPPTAAPAAATSPATLPIVTPTPEAPTTASAECDCRRDLFDCPAFSSWSAAQACYDRCRVLAGFDVHLLDEDADGVACELPPMDTVITDTVISGTATTNTATTNTAIIGTVMTDTVMTRASVLTATVPITTDQSGGASSVQPAPKITATTRAVTASVGGSHPPAAALTVTGSVTGIATVSANRPVTSSAIVTESAAVTATTPISAAMGNPEVVPTEETAPTILTSAKSAAAPALALIGRLAPWLIAGGVVVVLVFGSLLALIIVRSRRPRATPEPYTTVQK